MTPGPDRTVGLRRPGGGPGPRAAAFRWLVLSLAALMAGSCGTEGPRRTGDPSVEIRVGFSPTPPLVGEAGIRVEARADDRPLGPDATVRVRAGMPDGTAAPDGPEARHPGSAAHTWDTLASSGGPAWTGTLHFREAGVRTLIVEVRTGDGREARFTRPVTVSAAPAPTGPGGNPGA